MCLDFESVYEASSKHGTLVARDRALALVREAVGCLPVEGEFWECGVYRGGSARLLAEVVKPAPRTLRLFDTFYGLPAPSGFDTHREGEFKASMWDVASFLQPYDFIHLHPGVIPRSFEGLEDTRIAFCHLDLDLYWSTRDALAFVWPRLRRGGAIVIDDYEWEGDNGCPGVKRAVDESGLTVKQTADFQCVIWKKRLNGHN